MNTLEQKILDYSISHWQKDFTGISGMDIAQYFKIPHKKVLAILDKLEQQKREAKALQFFSKRFYTPTKSEAFRKTRFAQTSLQ